MTETARYFPGTDLAAEYQAGTEEMEALQDGTRLAAAAASIARMLPAGRLRLLSTSPEGAGLAAVCAASRGASTSWQFAHLAYPPRTRIGEQVVFIEAIDPGEAWEAAVKRCYGDALILYVTELVESQSQAA